MAVKNGKFSASLTPSSAIDLLHGLTSALIPAFDVEDLRLANLPESLST
jgi:hypothetical protein